MVKSFQQCRLTYVLSEQAHEDCSLQFGITGFIGSGLEKQRVNVRYPFLDSLGGPCLSFIRSLTKLAHVNGQILLRPVLVSIYPNRSAPFEV